MRRDFVPASDDILCERCGYLLNGLPEDGNCPECGLPVADSTAASPRRPTPWEAGRDKTVGRFQVTAAKILTGPKLFFRSMTAHGDTKRSAAFGRLALLPAVLFNTKTIVMHAGVMYLAVRFPPMWFLIALLVATPVLVYLTWLGLYALVVRLTTLESRYWGMRLPSDVVRRALHYNAVQVSAASLLPWAVTLTYLCLLIADESAVRFLTPYLYVLSGAVVISAVYLFAVYATSMRALMYANR